jgi:hypothetical protein
LIQFKGHRAEWFNDALIIAGGDLSRTEKCTLTTDGKFECVEVATLSGSNEYGSTLIVAEDFCV